jgi:hypothetical protein
MTPEKEQYILEEVIKLKGEVMKYYNLDIEAFFLDLGWRYAQEEVDEEKKRKAFSETEQFLFLMAFTVQSQQRVSSVLEWKKKTVTQTCSRKLFKHLGEMFRTNVDWSSIHRTIIENGEYINLPPNDKLASK